MKIIYLTVTNDLTYDQRMFRICSSLSQDYKVTLVGRQLKNSLPFTPATFGYKRIRCFFNKGSLFYAEYNFRLFFYLLFRNMDGICAIDLDTILPCYFIALIKGCKSFYDAHELFTEMKEVRSRPAILKLWTAIEKFAVPRFQYCYTVSNGLAIEFQKRYNKDFTIIRNVSIKREIQTFDKREKFILYQGAVNEARGFEQLVPAMQYIDAPLIICGNGNFMSQLKELIVEYNLQHKIRIKGMLLPEDLWYMTQQAYIGVNFTEAEGLNQIYCLPNKFFDYIQAGIPQVTNNYPEYQNINNEYKVSVLVDGLNAFKIAEAINLLLQNEGLYNELRDNALEAKKIFNWQAEEVKLLAFYKKAFAE